MLQNNLFGTNLKCSNKMFSFIFLNVADLPSPPTINNKKAETLSCDVNITWSRPVDNGCPFTMYSVYYRQIQPQERGASWLEVQIVDVSKTHYVLSLSCNTQYAIEMSAWNDLGQSDRSKQWIIKTQSGKFPSICTLNMLCVSYFKFS